MKRVLIADDEPAIVVSLDFLMRQQGFDTAVARDGDEALIQAERFRPHLVLLDLMLPLKSGLDVCRTLRAVPLYDEVKILLLTARGGQQDIVSGQEAGADKYLVKPFSTQELVAQVRGMLGLMP